MMAADDAGRKRSQPRIPLARTSLLDGLTAATASNVGDGIVLAALPLLAAELTREPLGVAATTMAVRLPWLVFGLLAGVIVDRVDRLRLMIWTDLGRAIVFLAIALIVATGHMTLTVLYIAVFGVGIVETLFDTAAMSMTPALVDREQLDRANARIQRRPDCCQRVRGSASRWPPIRGVRGRAVRGKRRDVCRQRGDPPHRSRRKLPSTAPGADVGGERHPGRIRVCLA